MPVTSIRIPQEDGSFRNLQFYTTDVPEGTFVGVRLCNDEWIPSGDPAETLDERSEEEYHTALRAAAHEKGQFVSQYSTDPEWNPEGLKPLTDEPI